MQINLQVNLPLEIKQIYEIFSKTSYKLFLVGGAVRDLLMNRDVKDFDFTTDATPEQILELFPDGFYNNKFGTVGIDTTIGVIEITTMRKDDEYNDFRHPSKVTWTTNIEEDLKRRDFTINAMALDKELFVIDPFNGQTDLKNKLLRAVGDPNRRFHEDALRLMRAIRFATQLNFSIETETFKAIKLNTLRIQNISWERIRDELFKIIASDNAYEGVCMLKETGLMTIILPELERCFGIMQEGPKHDRVYDIGDHSFRSLKFCPSNDPIVKFASLIHDVGKVDTYKVTADGNATFYGHDHVGGQLAKRICERLRLSKKDTERVVKLVTYHLFTVDEHQTDSAIRRFVKNVGVENLDDMFDLREADRLGGSSNPSSWRLDVFKRRCKEILKKPFSITDLKVNGKDVMTVLNIKPGRQVGDVLDKLFTEVLQDKDKNNREYLLKRIKQLMP